LSFQIRQQAGSLQVLLLSFETGQQQQGICYAENCNVLLKSPIGACPRAAIAGSGLTGCLSACRTSAAVGVMPLVITA
jgi:hypothetical protein